MSESKYPLDADLCQFAEDLRTLTPRSHCLTNDISISASECKATLCIDQIDAPELQKSAIAISTSNWFRTVTVAWSIGLAVGILVSAMWHRWPSLSDQHPSEVVVLTVLNSPEITQHSTSSLLESKASSSTAAQEQAPVFRNFKDATRPTSNHLISNQMTSRNPLKPVHSVSRLLPLTGIRRIDEGMLEAQLHAPISSSDDFPDLYPTTESTDAILTPSNQHHLLERLIEDGDVVLTRRALHKQDTL